MEPDEVFSVGVGQHVFLGGIHHRHGAGELLAQHRRDLLPVGPHLLIPSEKATPMERDLASCVGSAPGSAASAALEHPLDCPGESPLF